MLTQLEKPTRDLLDATSKLQWDGRSTSTLSNGKPALGQEIGVPSLLCQQMPKLEAEKAFLQGCKAVGDPFPLHLHLTFSWTCSAEPQLTLLIN